MLMWTATTFKSPERCRTASIVLGPTWSPEPQSWVPCSQRLTQPLMNCYVPGGSDGKASACNVGDPSSIPGSGRSPGEGNDNPLQSSCLENPMDGGAWWATVHGVTKKRSDMPEWLHFYFHPFLQLWSLIGLTQELNPGLLHCKCILYHLSHQGSPNSTPEWMSNTVPFCHLLSQIPGNDQNNITKRENKWSMENNERDISGPETMRNRYEQVNRMWLKEGKLVRSLGTGLVIDFAGPSAKWRCWAQVKKWFRISRWRH